MKMFNEKECKIVLRFCTKTNRWRQKRKMTSWISEILPLNLSHSLSYTHAHTVSRCPLVFLIPLFTKPNKLFSFFHRYGFLYTPFLFLTINGLNFIQRTAISLELKKQTATHNLFPSPNYLALKFYNRGLKLKPSWEPYYISNIIVDHKLKKISTSNVPASKKYCCQKYLFKLLTKLCNFYGVKGYIKPNIGQHASCSEF